MFVFPNFAFPADDCSPSSLSSPPHLVKTCGMKDGHVACSIACETGYRFIDEDKITKTYMCKDKMWFPSGVTPACVPLGKYLDLQRMIENLVKLLRS